MKPGSLNAQGGRSVWPHLLVRLALGMIFLWAGAEKIAHPEPFFASLLDYRVPFPETFLRIVAISLPWLEVLCGFCLLANAWAETVRPVVGVLCLVFILMLGQALLRGIDLANCGCFGPSAYAWIDRPAIALLRATLLLAGAIYLCSPRESRSFEQLPS